ncbi:MAG TPA: 23S rRNA (uracil(1939)-C(5))-methyltransferase RlmD [Spirochaetia bacterium]|nr:23S rRNA (uracil(1939)-C(5))-methyltransferase RlmD [Spirochaetia bacterium]
MARKKTYENLEIIDLEYQGNGVAKPEGRVVFVEGVLPGEVVDVRVTRRKKDVAFAVPTEFHATSERRIDPFCEHFADCGGCTWQYLGYEDQLAYKERFVAEVLERLGGVTEPRPMPIIGCEQDRFYRNKLDFSFSPTRWLSASEVGDGEDIPDRRALGFHVKGRFNRVLDINTCYLQRDPSNAIRTAARRIALEHDLSFHDPGEHVGLLRSLIIRTTEDDEVMVILVIGEERPDIAAMLLGRLMEEVPQITSAHYIVNTTRNDDVGPHEAHHVAGTKVIHERCGHLRFAIHPKSFYQTNSRQAERLYAVVRDWLEFEENDTLLDLYCGIGSIGLFLADRATRVIGVEYVEEAVDRARENAALNGFSNTEFHAGDVRSLLAGVGRDRSAIPRPDLIVLDPPRAGVHPDVIDELIRLAPRQMIYVSCKPSTQARDLARLRERYHIERIQPVDMFPQTFHIESVVDLRRKED